MMSLYLCLPMFSFIFSSTHKTEALCCSHTRQKICFVLSSLCTINSCCLVVVSSSAATAIERGSGDGNYLEMRLQCFGSK